MGSNLTDSALLELIKAKHAEADALSKAALDLRKAADQLEVAYDARQKAAEALVDMAKGLAVAS